jgi:hypothetical protein
MKAIMLVETATGWMDSATGKAYRAETLGPDALLSPDGIVVPAGILVEEVVERLIDHVSVDELELMLHLFKEAWATVAHFDAQSAEAAGLLFMVVAVFCALAAKRR